jgi:hypothetical protein
LSQTKSPKQESRFRKGSGFRRFERLSVGDDPFSLSGDHDEERFDEGYSSY